jgi:hypothetical protein
MGLGQKHAPSLTQMRERKRERVCERERERERESVREIECGKKRLRLSREY